MAGIILIALLTLACIYGFLGNYLKRKRYFKVRYRLARWLLKNTSDEMLDMLVEDIKMGRMPLELQEAHVYLAYGKKVQASEIIDKYLKVRSCDKVAIEMLKRRQAAS